MTTFKAKINFDLQTTVVANWFIFGTALLVYDGFLERTFFGSREKIVDQPCIFKGSAKFNSTTKTRAYLFLCKLSCYGSKTKNEVDLNTLTEVIFQFVNLNV